MLYNCVIVVIVNLKRKKEKEKKGKMHNAERQAGSNVYHFFRVKYLFLCPSVTSQRLRTSR